MINLDGQETGREIMPKADCQERVMWRCCLLLTIQDALRHVAGRPLDRLRCANAQRTITTHLAVGSDALEMIRDDTDDYRYLCDKADVCSVTLRKRVLAEVEKIKASKPSKMDDLFNEA